VVLRRVLPADAPDVREIQFYEGVAAVTVADAAAMLARIDEDMAEGLGLHWGICEVGHAEVAGTCGFYRGYPDNVGEVGYALRSAYRGRGLMTAALRLVVSFGFERLGLSGIVAYTDPDNHSSQGVLGRVGFVRVPAEGRDHKYALARPAPPGGVGS
jgi:ribosomal-protein-alanine N-acetyltransferase